MDRVQALADYLGIDVSEIEVEDNGAYYDTRYITPKGTYLILDETESRQEVYDYLENTIDELGIYGAFTPDFTNWIEENAIDQDVFKDWLWEDYEDQADELQDEDDSYYGNQLYAECVDLGIINEDEIIDGEYTGNLDLFSEYADKMIENIENSGETFSEHMRNRFDDEIVQGILNDGYGYDLDAIVDEAIDWDGYGHFIASWDGKTHELENNLYAYKQDE